VTEVQTSNFAYFMYCPCFIVVEVD